MTEKRPSSIITIIVVTVILAVLVAVVLFLLRRSQSALVATNTPIGPSTVAAQPPVGDGAKTKTPDATAPRPPPTPPTQKPSPESKRTLRTLNHNPIEFYGRAVDQYGEPVAGAEVSGVVLYNTGTKAGEKKAKTTTDAQGYFCFADLEGQDLGIGIAKEGYEYRNRNSSFSYSYFEADHKRHIPDPKNPVTFTLWKKQGAEPLVQYDRVWRLPVNSGPVEINLATGKMGDRDVDLVVTVSRTPLRMPYGEGGFAWAASIEVVNGGLMRAGRRDYYNQAPVSGYQPRFEYTQAAQSVRDAQEGRIKWTWIEGISETFFVSSRNEKHFARVTVRIRPNVDRKEGDNEALIAAEVWLNPNGSRNLEFDPKKAIRPAP